MVKYFTSGFAKGEKKAKGRGQKAKISKKIEE